jgi:hypothetical protein
MKMKRKSHPAAIGTYSTLPLYQKGNKGNPQATSVNASDFRSSSAKGKPLTRRVVRRKFVSIPKERRPKERENKTRH